MSVKRIIVVSIATLILVGFTVLGISDAVKTKDKLDFQEIQLKSKSTEIKQLNVKYEKLNMELDKAAQDKNTSQEQLDKLNKEKQELDAQNKKLQAELQAKRESQNKIALASVKTINTATGTQTASAMSGGGCSQWLGQAGITHPIAVDLINRENRGCNPCVYNNGSATGAVDCNYSGDNAYGIPQAMPGNKMASEGADWRTNPVTQLRWMQKYVYERYGSWEGAQAHHDRMGWY